MDVGEEEDAHVVWRARDRDLGAADDGIGERDAIHPGGERRAGEDREEEAREDAAAGQHPSTAHGPVSTCSVAWPMP